MTENFNELIRRVELLAAVMNGSAKSKADFAAEFGVAEVTINRDLEWLRSSGIQLFSRKGKIVLDAQPDREILNLLAADYLPLKLNSDVFLKKIRIHSKLNNPNYFNHLTLITKAVNEGRYLKINYRRLSDNKLNNYLLMPVRLIPDEFNWILHAFKKDETILKTFYLSRIADLKVLDTKFEKTPLPEENKEIEEIILRFHPSVEQEIFYKIWFEDFEITRDDDGFIFLKTRQPITNKLAAWCISWWDRIEIVESNNLKNYCAEMIEIFKKTLTI